MSETDSLGPPPSLQRRISMTEQQNASFKPEDKAALKIQALARGNLARKKERDKKLWDAWNELDWKEESELMASHQAYEEMKQNIRQKHQAALGNISTADDNKHEQQQQQKLDTQPQSQSQSQSSSSSTTPSHPSSTSTTPHAASPASSTDTSPATTPPASPKTYLIRTKSVNKAAQAEKAKVKKEAEQDDGLELTDPITLDFVTAMMDAFKFNKILDLEHVVEILRRVKVILKMQPNVVKINVSTRLTVVGDLHGQLDDLFAIFKLNGLPSPRNVYLFNGDFVDRGQFSCECALTLFAFKVLYPKSLHLNRGNHEARDINSRDGFEKECLLKYNHAVFDLFSDVFACLPLASVINNEVLVVHGGLASSDFMLSDLDQEDRFHEVPPSDSLMEEVMWSDPDRKSGRRPSPRGAGLLFGPDVTQRFLMMNNLKLIIRSHECMQKGFEMHHNDSVITVFSASNYCGTVNNEGAFIIFERDMVPRIVPFFAKPKERLSRYRMRHAVMENDIIAKLLQRISDNRLPLTQYYRSIHKETPAGIHIISRQQWADGLKSVLKLNIPFLEFQDYLGLPKLGVDGKRKGDIDYMAFLHRFRPVNILLDRMAQDEGTAVTQSASESMEQIVSMLSRNRYELESLFRFLDSNGDEKLSAKEFKEGIFSLQHVLHEHVFSEKDVDTLIRAIDTDNDGYVSYSEFFSSFTVQDPELASIEKSQQDRMSSRRTGTGVNRARDGSPSPAVSPPKDVPLEKNAA